MPFQNRAPEARTCLKIKFFGISTIRTTELGITKQKILENMMPLSTLQ